MIFQCRVTSSIEKDGRVNLNAERQNESETKSDSENEIQTETDINPIRHHHKKRPMDYTMHRDSYYSHILNNQVLVIAKGTTTTMGSHNSVDMVVMCLLTLVDTLFFAIVHSDTK